MIKIEQTDFLDKLKGMITKAGLLKNEHGLSDQVKFYLSHVQDILGQAYDQAKQDFYK